MCYRCWVVLIIAENNIALWWHQTMLSVALYAGDAGTANTITSRMASKVVVDQISANGNLTQEVMYVHHIRTCKTAVNKRRECVCE